MLEVAAVAVLGRRPHTEVLQLSGRVVAKFEFVRSTPPLFDGIPVEARTLGLAEAVPLPQELDPPAEDCTQVPLVEAHKRELQVPLAVAHTQVAARTQVGLQLVEVEAAALQPRHTHLQVVAGQEHTRERLLNMVVAEAAVRVLQAAVVEAARRLTESQPTVLSTGRRSHTETGPVIAKERRICKKITE